MAYSKSYYKELVPTPNRKYINTGYSAAKVATLKSVFGAFPNLPENCGTCHNPKVSKLLTTQDVGPFRITLIRPAMENLKTALRRLNQQHPNLYSILGTEGGMCYRRVRGSSSPSNHSAGTAIDFNVGGILPEMDTTPETPMLIPRGFLVLYPYMREMGYFWAAGYAGRVDSMHFEIADEVLRKWHSEGKI